MLEFHTDALNSGVLVIESRAPTDIQSEYFIAFFIGCRIVELLLFHEFTFLDYITQNNMWILRLNSYRCQVFFDPSYAYSTMLT